MAVEIKSMLFLKEIVIYDRNPWNLYETAKTAIEFGK
jgi:hypothetical protein